MRSLRDIALDLSLSTAQAVEAIDAVLAAKAAADAERLTSRLAASAVLDAAKQAQLSRDAAKLACTLLERMADAAEREVARHALRELCERGLDCPAPEPYAPSGEWTQPSLQGPDRPDRENYHGRPVGVLRPAMVVAGLDAAGERKDAYVIHVKSAPRSWTQFVRMLKVLHCVARLVDPDTGALVVFGNRLPELIRLKCIRTDPDFAPRPLLGYGAPRQGQGQTAKP